MAKSEKVLYRAWRDSTTWLLNSFAAWILAPIVTVGCGVLVALFIPTNASLRTQSVYGAIGAFIGLVLFVLAIYLIHLIITPYHLLNETRTENEKLKQEQDKLNQEYTRKINEIRINDPIVLEAQKKHLEDVKSQLKVFTEHFIPIELKYHTYYRDYPYQDLNMIQKHLPDNKFWGNVDIFKSKVLECDSILKELEREIRSKAETEVATQDETKTQHIMPNFWKTVIEVALKPDNFHRYDLIDQPPLIQIWANDVISVGIESEKKHREFINIYSQDNRCIKLAPLLEELRILRENILTRIQFCIGDSEYIHSHCARCPIEQQASHKEGLQT